MKEFRKRVDAVGRKFLESEISRGFPYLGRIGYDKVRNALAWIDSLSGIDKEKLVDDLFSLSSEGSLLVEELKGMVGGAVGPRFKFETRKKFLSKIVKEYQSLRFEYCDPQTVMASSVKGRFRILSVVSATDKLYNVSCSHDVICDDEQMTGSFSLLSATRIFHGDCWKDSELDYISVYDDVMAVLEKSYQLLWDEVLK